MYFANTHMHSTFSDGVYTPEKLVELGKEIGHKAMLLTDHDTISGQHVFHKAARKAGILTMTATELGCTCSFGRCHLVCVDFNTENEGVRQLLKYTSSCSTKYTHYMFEKAVLEKTIREGITWQDVLDANPGKDYLVNNHIFDVCKQKGIYKQEEYREFYNAVFDIPKDVKYGLMKELGCELPSIEETIDIILKADGVPIIAHPTEKGRYFFKEETENFIKMGVKGFEVSFPSSTKEQRDFYTAVCDEKGLYKLGGTDHSGTLGGYVDHPCNVEDGYTTEENFMKLYKRELW